MPRVRDRALYVAHGCEESPSGSNLDRNPLHAMMTLKLDFDERPRRLRDARRRFVFSEGHMDEHKDPMALWVGTWTPRDVIDREVQRLTPPVPEAPAHEQSSEPEPSPS
jgi:hypothetical protein